MKFFIDTADINEIRNAHEYGILDGITTNPTLVSKIGRPYTEVLTEIASEFDVPVSTEVISTDYDGMIREAHELAKLGNNVVIKIPLIGEGLKAVKTLASEGIPTNVTLCFSSLQALAAAKAGATYISPFVGRLDDINSDGMDLIEEIITIYNNYRFNTEVLVASVRHPIHIKTAALLGADIATIPFKIFEKIIKHPLTDRGIKQFIEDYNTIQ